MEVPDRTHSSIDLLWQKFQGGDDAVLGDLFQYVYRELYYYGLKLVFTPDVVKDTIQDIFADIWSRRRKMERIRNIRGYLFVSLRRELLRRVKRVRKEGPLDERVISSFEFSKEDFIIREERESEETRLLIQSLKRLTGRQREVILLRFNHELEFQEIALILNMNIQSVRNLLFRALEKIRREMNSPGTGSAPDVEMFLLTVFHQRRKHKLEVPDSSFLSENYLT